MLDIEKLNKKLETAFNNILNDDIDHLFKAKLQRALDKQIKALVMEYVSNFINKELEYIIRAKIDSKKDEIIEQAKLGIDGRIESEIKGLASKIRSGSRFY